MTARTLLFWLPLVIGICETLGCASAGDVQIIDYRLRESVGQKTGDSFWKIGMAKIIPISVGNGRNRYDYKLFNGCAFSIFVVADTEVIERFEYLGDSSLCTKLRGYRYGE
jgi:hypothetical protein